MKPNQCAMFTDASDSPLFSGTPARATLDIFNPQPVTSTARMFTCPACYDTGQVVSKGKTIKCPCQFRTPAGG